MNKQKYMMILHEALEERGPDFHLNLLQEEAAELIVAVNHFRRNRIKSDQIIEELADVSIVADAVRLLLDDEVGFQDVIEKKMNRLKERMKYKKENNNG